MRNLRNFSDIDKHRIIIPAVVMPYAGDIEIECLNGDPIDFKLLVKGDREIKVGTKIFSVVLTGGLPGKREVRVKGGMTMDAVIPKSILGPVARIPFFPLELTLNDIRTVCREIVDAVEAKG